MDLSIIIVHYNTPELFRLCIASIISSKPRCTYEIIVVDNGSNSELRIQNAEFRNKYKQVKIRVIQNEENAGFGKANNQGAKIAQGKYLLFLNTDIEVIENAVTRIYEFINDRKDVNIAGAKLLNRNLSNQASCGMFYSLPVIFAMLFMQGDRLNITRYSPPVSRIVDWVSGACFIISRRDFHSLKGFDEKMFMYMEEVELMLRARQEGMSVVFYPGTRFIHLGAATTKKSGDIRLSPVVNIFHGLLYVYRKHRPAREQRLLRGMLLTKARLSRIIATLIGNRGMLEVYRHAEEIVRNKYV